MGVIIVTDSASDLPSDVAEELGIKIVPLNVNFGTESFKDGVTISADEFYGRLIDGPVLPTTSQPSPGDFVEVYEQIPDDVDGVVSIHITSKLSGTYNSAIQAKNQINAKFPIEVIDTASVSMATGLIAIAAGETAKKGGSFEEVVRVAKESIEHTHVVALLDTLEYLQKGGRIGKAQSMVGSLLSIKPMITTLDGEVKPFSKARSFAKGLVKLKDFAEEKAPLASACVIYSTSIDSATEIAESITEHLSEGNQPMVTRIGPTIGTYGGPGVVGIALLSS